jgi:Uma2 family endonuclease
MAGGENLAAASTWGIDWPQVSPAEPEGMKRATYEDVLNAPENEVAEILDGELFLTPRPGPRPAVAASRVGRILGPYDDDPRGPGGWWILDEPELHLGDHVVVPDLAGWRRERMPTIPDEAFFSLAPGWVCEVLSPTTEKIDRSRKLRIYAEAGVEHAWLLKPTDRTLEVLHLHEGTWTIVGVCSGSDVVRIKPFEAIELELGRLWLDEAPASSSR